MKPMERSNSIKSATTQALPINISNISKAYGSVTALANVSLNINSGEFMTLLGPSGSGKTSLLMVIAGFSRPDSGLLKFGNEDVTLKPPHQREIGMMFQNYALFPHMTVLENVAYPLRVRKWKKAQIEAAVIEALETVQLSEYRNRRISELSGGQRQRIALARAVVFKPKILLMDEPLSALDKNLREQMQLELRTMHDRLGMTTILVTHDQREALTMSDRIAVLRSGQIEQVDIAKNIYDTPNTAFIAEFMGESNFLSVSAENGRFFHNEQLIKIAGNTSDLKNESFIVVRPEKLEIVTPELKHDNFNIFEGTLETVLFQGESCVAIVKLLTGETLSVRRNVREATKSLFPAKGCPISVGLHINDTHIVGSSR